MKFKVDENLPVEAGVILGDLNHDAHTVQGEGLQGCPDSSLYEVCIREGRILITLDLDFSDIRVYEPGSTPGIIVIRTYRQDRPYILQKITELCDILKRESIQGKLWIVEDERIRIRE
jgi:predicted nuclease of predicted toxin-antitoxin system